MYNYKQVGTDTHDRIVKSNKQFNKIHAVSNIVISVFDETRAILYDKTCDI